MQLRHLIIFLILICSALTGGCSADDTPPPSQHLNLGVMPSMDYLPLAVALREGYFTPLGMELKIIKFYSANERDAAFQSGNIDGAVIDYTGAALQQNGGVALALTSRCDAPFSLIASPQSKIKSLHELKGHSIAVSQNTVIDYFSDMALRHAGLTHQDVEKVEINKIPVRFEMLMGGKVDATALPHPLSMLAEAGGGTVLATNDLLSLSVTGIMFTDAAMKEKSELIAKMYLAYNKGVDYLKTHGPEDVQDILINDMGFKPELIAKTVLPNYGKAALPSEHDLQTVLDWLKERGLVKDNISTNSLVNGHFLPKAPTN